MEGLTFEIKKMKKKAYIVLGSLFLNLSFLMASGMDTIPLAFESEDHTLKGRLILPLQQEWKQLKVI